MLLQLRDDHARHERPQIRREGDEDVGGDVADERHERGHPDHRDGDRRHRDHEQDPDPAGAAEPGQEGGRDRQQRVEHHLDLERPGDHRRVAERRGDRHRVVDQIGSPKPGDGERCHEIRRDDPQEPPDGVGAKVDRTTAVMGGRERRVQQIAGQGEEDQDTRVKTDDRLLEPGHVGMEDEDHERGQAAQTIECRQTPHPRPHPSAGDHLQIAAGADVAASGTLDQEAVSIKRATGPDGPGREGPAGTSGGSAGATAAS